MGLEHKIADFPACWDLWFQVFDPKRHIAASELDAGTFLFPLCLLAPGWKHMVDLWIRAGLTRLTFFPGFVEKLKALATFLRSDNNKQVLIRKFKALGMAPVAEMIEVLSVPSFAAWRWGTLYFVCRAVHGVLSSLRSHFHVAWFRNQRDATQFGLVVGALTSELWVAQFKFILWFTAWLGDLMSWGCGCDCHAPTDPDFETCPFKGRRIKKLYLHAKACLDSGLAIANAWTTSSWNIGREFWLQAQTAVRLVHRLAFRRIEFLDTIPYLCARLDEEGIAARCISQWQEGLDAGKRHHRVSAQFLQPGGPLRTDVEAVVASNPLSSELEAACARIANIPLGDSIGEGPHAIATRISKTSTGSKWAWMASTARLKQNITDVRELVPDLDCTLDELWVARTSILQSDPSKADALCPKKVPKKKLLSYVYHMFFLCRGLEASSRPWCSTRSRRSW